MAAQDLALVEARGLANETFGEDVDIGTVGGQPWALVSNGQGFYCESQAYRGTDWSNPEVVIDGGEGACNAKWTGSVADWPIAPFITNGHGGLLAAYGITVGVVDDDDPYTNIHLGSQDSEVHDIDLDGVDDLMVSQGNTAFALFLGPPPARTFLPPVLELRWGHAQNLAYRIGEAGDLTGDGLPEITLYAEDDPDGGRAWILPGDARGLLYVDDLGWDLVGEEPFGEAGFSIALGDATGDGHLDLLTGAPLAQSRGGTSFLVAGPITEPGRLAEGIARFEPLYPSDWCGVDVEFLADRDGDGFDEVVLGCPRDPYGGEFGAPLLPGRVEIYAGQRAEGTLGAQDANLVLVGRAPNDQFGVRLSADADLDGDGLHDLAVSAPYDPTNGPFAGAVFLFTDLPW